MRIRNTEKVTLLLGRWNPGDLAYLTALHIEGRRVRIESLWQSRGHTWPNAAEPCHRVVLECEGVVGLKLQWSGGPTQVMGFEIEDITDRQWDHIRFLIGDYENDVIKLSCAEITVVEAEPAGPLRYALD